MRRSNLTNIFSSLYLTVLLLFFPACATWQYGNAKYPSSEAALRAAIADMNDTVNSIEALPAPLAKSARIVIPNLERIHIKRFATTDLHEASNEQLGYIINALQLGFHGKADTLIHYNLFGEVQHYDLSDEEQHNYMATLLQLGFQGMTRSLVKRNLFGEVLTHEEYDTSNIASGNEDYLIWLYLTDQGLGQWYMKPGKAGDSMTITIDISKERAPKVMTWLNSIQKNIVSSGSFAQTQAAAPAEESSPGFSTGEAPSSEAYDTSNIASGNEDYLMWLHLTEQESRQWYIKAGSADDGVTNNRDVSREGAAQELTQSESIQDSMLPSGPFAETQAAAPVTESASGFITTTGFIVSNDGYILTSHHAVNDCRLITMRLEHEEDVLALIAQDPVNDLALLKSQGDFQDIALFSRSSVVKTGENISVIGFPFSGQLSHQAQLTTGVVTADAGIIDYMSLLQIKASVQPGHSGGPLIDEHGNVIGIVVGKVHALKMLKRTDNISQDINFAVRNSEALIFLDSYRVNYRIDDAAHKKLGAKDIAARAVKYTVPIDCWQ